MAYNETTVERIRQILQQKEANFYEKVMFGGICFMVEDKMLCACKFDKAKGEDLLMCRLSEADALSAIKQDGVVPMDFTGKSMKGYVYVGEEAHTSLKDLAYWVQLCLDFNPFAKASKRK